MSPLYFEIHFESIRRDFSRYFLHRIPKSTGLFVMWKRGVSNMFSRRISIAVGLILCLISVAFAYESVLVSMAEWLDVGEPPRAVDYVMVLPGGAQQRPFVAVAMIHAGMAKGILTDETESDPAIETGLAPSEDSIFREVLLRRGIREDQFQILRGQSNSTWADALILAKFMKEHPHATFAIVTNSYHTRRSRAVFQRVLGAEARRVYFISAPKDGVEPATWWTTEDGLTTYLSEYSKLVIYAASDPTLIVPALGVLIVFLLIWRRSQDRRSSSELPKSHGH